MRHEILHLNHAFPALAELGGDPVLTVYLPDNLTEMDRREQKRPCMLLLPGGGYGMVSQRESEPIALHLLPHGYNVFVLTYSVAPHRFPTQLTQVAAAMELICKNSSLWHCDTEKIAIMGFSAGGHLAAHYTNAYNHPLVRRAFPESKPVQASVLCYPVITALPAHSHRGSFENLLGRDPEGEEIAQLSCDQLVSEQTPPTFLWHTAQDGAVPVMNSLLYAQALSKNGVPFEMHIFPEGRHGLSTADGQTNDDAPMLGYVRQWLPAMLQWLNALFGVK